MVGCASSMCGEVVGVSCFGCFGVPMYAGGWLETVRMGGLDGGLLMEHGQASPGMVGSERRMTGPKEWPCGRAG